MPRFFAQRFFNAPTSGGGGGSGGTITLAVTDNADGTGGVATISGNDDGTVVTLFASTFDGQLGPGVFASMGTRVGAGTIAVAPPLGYYWWYADGTAGGTANTISD